MKLNKKRIKYKFYDEHSEDEDGVKTFYSSDFDSLDSFFGRYHLLKDIGHYVIPYIFTGNKWRRYKSKGNLELLDTD